MGGRAGGDTYQAKIVSAGCSGHRLEDSDQGYSKNLQKHQKARTGRDWGGCFVSLIEAAGVAVAVAVAVAAAEVVAEVGKQRAVRRASASWWPWCGSSAARRVQGIVGGCARSQTTHQTATDAHAGKRWRRRREGKEKGRGGRGRSTRWRHGEMCTACMRSNKNIKPCSPRKITCLLWRASSHSMGARAPR